MPGSAGLEDSARDGGPIFSFKSSQARCEELAAGNHHDIEARRDIISTKNLSNQTLSAISDDRAAQALRSRDAQPADIQPVRLREYRVGAARNADAMVVDVLKIGVSPDPLARAELQTLFAADSKTLAAFCATTLQDETAILRAHAHQEPVRAHAAAGVWLECALTLHSILPGTRTSTV